MILDENLANILLKRKNNKQKMKFSAVIQN